jgi:hypothetical protein
MKNKGLLHIFVASALLFYLTAGLTASPEPNHPAKTLLQRYCKDDFDGKQLSSEGFELMSRMFEKLPSSPPVLAHVIRDDWGVVTDLHPQGNTVNAYMEYINLGRLNLKTLHYSATPLLKNRESFAILRGNGISGAANGVEPRAVSPEWIIQGSIPEPRISVDVALAYLTRGRSLAKTAEGQREIDKAIKLLERQR